MLSMKSIYKMLVLGMVMGVASAAHAAPTLTVGTGSGQAGTTVNFPITFNPTTDSVGGIQFNLTLPASISTVSVTAGTIVTAAGKSISTNKSGATWSIIVFGLNQNTIASGLLATVQVRIAAGTATGNLSIPLSAVVYVDTNGNPITAGTSTNGTVTVTPPTPVITSAGTAMCQVGVAFSYTITATNSPTSYNATGLPAGLSINTTTGLISGTPTTAGTPSITLSATNAGGTGTRVLVLTINVAAPVITSGGSATGTTGTSFTYTITATNSPTSYGATGLPGGLSINGTTGVISGTPSTAGTSSITLSATNAGGTGTRSLSLTVNSACDLNTDSTTNVSDVQLSANQAIGVSACTGDINKDSFCNVIDVQRIVNAVLGGVCVTP